MQNSKQGSYVIAILVVIIILLIAGGVYLYAHTASKQPASSGSTSASALHPGTYDNFGISFQYPPAWGIAQESFYENDRVPLQSVTLSTSTDADSEALLVYTWQDSGPGSQMEDETFDQMIARFQANDRQISSVKDIMVDGIAGREIYYNSAVSGQPYEVNAYFQISSSTYAVFAGDYGYISQTDFDNSISTFHYDSSDAPKTDAATGMFIYSNNGIHFEYPPAFATPYAQLTMMTNIEKEDTTKLGANGCYPGGYTASGRPASTTIVTTPDGISFCYDTMADIGAGQLYQGYEYTTFHNGFAYMISYGVHTTNACGGYENSPDPNAPGNEQYKACLAAESDYSDLVLKPIQQSIATFGFGN